MNFLEAMDAVKKGKKVASVGEATYYLEDNKLVCIGSDEDSPLEEGDFDIEGYEINGEWRIEVEKYTFFEAIKCMRNNINMRPRDQNIKCCFIEDQLMIFSKRQDAWMPLTVTSEMIDGEWITC